MSRPGHGDHAQDATDDEEHPRSDGHLALRLLIFNTVGALSTCHSKQDSHEGNQDGDHNQGAGRLQVTGQRQHGVVDLALHLSGALLHTIHPQALPEDLRRDDVVPDESRDLPHGQGTDDDVSQKADGCQEDAEDLKTCRSHICLRLRSVESQLHQQ